MNEALARFAAAAASVTDRAEMETFLAELLTPNELHDLVLRWELLELLEEGVSQRQVAAALGISLCKITRGAKILKRAGSVSARVLKHMKSASQEESDAGADLAFKSPDQARR